MGSRKGIRITLIILAAILVLIQFVPVSRDNPPVVSDFDDPVLVKQILNRSCYDCHSNETSWPWYSSIAPISWLVASDVNEAREHLNFSEWGSLQTDDQLLARKKIWKEIEKGQMPLGNYLLMHGDAKLSESDKSVIQRWSSVPSAVDDSVGNQPDPD
jgi:hypothetical protein